MGRLRVEERQISAGLPQLLKSEEQGAQASSIEFRQIAKIERHSNSARIEEAIEFPAEIQILFAEREMSAQSQNLDSLPLAVRDCERHPILSACWP